MAKRPWEGVKKKKDQLEGGLIAKTLIKTSANSRLSFPFFQIFLAEKRKWGRFESDVPFFLPICVERIFNPIVMRNRGVELESSLLFCFTLDINLFFVMF